MIKIWADDPLLLEFNLSHILFVDVLQTFFLFYFISSHLISFFLFIFFNLAVGYFVTLKVFFLKDE